MRARQCEQALRAALLQVRLELCRVELLAGGLQHRVVNAGDGLLPRTLDRQL